MSDGDDNPVYDAVLVNAGATPTQDARWYVLGTVVVSVLGMLAIALLLLVWPPRMGIRLAGGLRLVYEVADEQSVVSGATSQTSQASVTPELLDALRRRLNPSGTKEVIVQRVDTNRVEVLLPDVDVLEYELIKKSISTAGSLRFLIVANSKDHGHVISRAGNLPKIRPRSRRKPSAMKTETSSASGVAFRAIQVLASLSSPLPQTLCGTRRRATF